MDDDEDDGEKYDLSRKVDPKYIKLLTRHDDDMMARMMGEFKKFCEKRDDDKTNNGGNQLEGSHKMFERFEHKKQKKDRELKKRDDRLEREENFIDFRRLIKEKNTMNDLKMFKKMSLSEQRLVVEELRRVNDSVAIEKPYRLSLLESSMDAKFKADAMKKINMLNFMDPGSGEYYKVKQWVDTFMRIPFGKTSTLPVKLDDGVEKCQEFMETAKTTLDNCVYGLNDAKMQIMQMMGQWISNPESAGTAIAIHGPMGTGKTTLVKEGISKILNRPFAFIALGGATDSSFLEGHSYTYEGSVWGKIVDIIIKSKCMNPVIYFDELDKVSNTAKGEEIIGILTHLTDVTQNSQFHDKYFASVDFDLSKALFIFSYNDESKVNAILKDRMYRITTKGYTKAEKITIARDYLIPSIEKSIRFEKGDIELSDEVIGHIIDTNAKGEKGVRNLRRCLEIVYTKLNLYRLMKPDSTLFDKKKTLTVTFPYKVQTEVISKLITKTDENSVPFGMYM